MAQQVKVLLAVKTDNQSLTLNAHGREDQLPQVFFCLHVGRHTHMSAHTHMGKHTPTHSKCTHTSITCHTQKLIPKPGDGGARL